MQQYLICRVNVGILGRVTNLLGGFPKHSKIKAPMAFHLWQILYNNISNVFLSWIEAVASLSNFTLKRSTFYIRKLWWSLWNLLLHNSILTTGFYPKRIKWNFFSFRVAGSRRLTCGAACAWGRCRCLPRKPALLFCL